MLYRISYSTLSNVPILKVFIHAMLIAHCKVLINNVCLLIKINTAPGQLLLQILHEHVPVCPIHIHLIYKNKGWNMVLVKKLPHRPRVGLHTIRSAYDKHRIVKDCQCSLHLRRKIHMPRCIKQRKICILRLYHCLLCKYGYSPESLQFIGVKECVLIIHPSKPSYHIPGVQKSL